MTLYFFDIVEQCETFSDDIGTECTNYAEMRAFSLRTICEMAAHTRWQAEPPHYGIVVRDADSREVYAVSLNLVERGQQAV